MTPRRRTAAAWALVAAGLVAAGVALSHFNVPTVHVAGASVAALDTVDVAGRRVLASLGGVVHAVGTDGTVWVGTVDRAFAVRGAEAESLRVEERVLVFGRVRAGRGERWLDAHAVARVVAGPSGHPSRGGERPDSSAVPPPPPAAPPAARPAE